MIFYIPPESTGRVNINRTKGARRIPDVLLRVLDFNRAGFLWRRCGFRSTSGFGGCVCVGEGGFSGLNGCRGGFGWWLLVARRVVWKMKILCLYVGGFNRMFCW